MDRIITNIKFKSSSKFQSYTSILFFDQYLKTQAGEICLRLAEKMQKK